MKIRSFLFNNVTKCYSFKWEIKSKRKKLLRSQLGKTKKNYREVIIEVFLKMKRLKKEIVLTTEKNITDEDKTRKKNISETLIPKKKLLIHVIFFFEFLIMQQRVHEKSFSYKKVNGKLLVEKASNLKFSKRESIKRSF